MGKNHKHAKKLKSEKNKVHIKSKTKFLPKGQNITNTSFKVKSIVIQSQLNEKATSTIEAKKHINIDELVTKLKHYNDTVKSDSCQELKDIISANPESIQEYLSIILQNASVLIQDRERKVRRVATKLLNSILEKISDDKIRPFFNYILANLKCAMTNINKHIQEDSLLLLDAILEHKNVLISENFDAFFSNFLMLISKLKSQFSSERSLSLNLEGKVTSVKWRVKVLARLYGLLDAKINSKLNENIDNRHDFVVTLQAKNVTSIPIYKDVSLYEKNYFGLMVKKPKDKMDFDGHFLNLFQLLHEIWMEVLPEKTKKNSLEVTVLPNEEAIAIFSCIVHILLLLQKFIQSSGNDQIYTDIKIALFMDNLMSNFPFVHHKKNLEITKEFPKCFSLTHDSNCVEENLIIIFLFIKIRLKNNSPRQKKIQTYLNKCLESKLRLNTITFTYLIKILKEILLEQPYLCRKLGINESEMVENVANFYACYNIPEKFKNEVLEILTNSKLVRHTSWMAKLPEFLCENRIPSKLIDGILDLCRKGQKDVQDGVKQNLKRILLNLDSLTIFGDEETARKNLMNIFFYITDLTESDVLDIYRFIDSNPDSKYAVYLRNVIEFRLIFK